MPIDNITIQLKDAIPAIALKENGPFEYWGLIFVPHHSITGEIYEFTAKFKNLWIRIQPPYNRCIIQNSWHKFLHGSNYTDFTISDIDKVASLLSDQLQVNVHDAIIKRIECGCNITVPDCKSTWNRMGSFRTKDYQPMISRGKRYGMSCDCTQYKIKAYDKTFQVKQVDKIRIPPNLFRWELAVKSMAFLHKRKEPIPTYTVSDLIESDKLQYLCAETVNKYRQSLKTYAQSMEGYSLSQLTSFARQDNTTIREIIKQHRPHTYIRDRLQFKKLVKNFAEGEDPVEKALTTKFADLLTDVYRCDRSIFRKLF